MAKKQIAKKKSTVKGKSKLKQAPKVEKIKVLLLIVLAALIGGFSVWLANAGTKNYSYKVSICSPIPSGVVINPATGVISGGSQQARLGFENCVSKSADALTYRLYAGLAGRQPENLSVPEKSTDGFVYWRNLLSEKKDSPERVAQKMLCVDELKNKGLTGTVNNGCNPPLGAYAQKQMNNEQYVNWLYKNMLGKADTKVQRGSVKEYKFNHDGRMYWKKELDGKKRTRYNVAAYFATSNEVSKYQQPNFVKFVVKQLTARN